MASKAAGSVTGWLIPGALRWHSAFYGPADADGPQVRRRCSVEQGSLRP